MNITVLLASVLVALALSAVGMELVSESVWIVI